MDHMHDSYQVEIDTAGPQQWSSMLIRFDDSTIFQAWDYGAHKFGRDRLTHIVIRKGRQVVAAAQGCILKLPGLRSGIVHFSWCPMWRPRGRAADAGNLQMLLRNMFQHYAVSRGLLVRIRSYEVAGDSGHDAVAAIFQKEGFKPSPRPHYRTLRLDLSNSLESLRKNFSKSWKRHLRAAEKKSFSIVQGTGDDLYETFAGMHNEMRRRKKIVKYNPEIEMYRTVQKKLPGHLKMIAMICMFEGEAIAANVVSVMGNTGMYLFGCSSNRAIRENLRGSYLLHWQTMKWLKSQGCRWYDLKGYNPEAYAGVSRFKAGTRGEIVSFSEFIGCANMLSMATVACGEGFRRLAKTTAIQMKRLSHQLTGG